MHVFNYFHTSISIYLLINTSISSSSFSFSSSINTELRVVWSDEYGNPDAVRMGMRFIEDSVYGTYVTPLYSLLFCSPLSCSVLFYALLFAFLLFPSLLYSSLL